MAALVASTMLNAKDGTQFHGDIYCFEAEDCDLGQLAQAHSPFLHAHIFSLPAHSHFVLLVPAIGVAVVFLQQSFSEHFLSSQSFFEHSF